MSISIIVPIYNTELYLPQCVNSLLNQTFKEIEIILVDDGSTDNSGMLCDGYLQKDSRIRVLHQCNQGRISARENGLKSASGKYVLFVDSDDWIERDMCEKMIRFVLQYEVDMVTSGFIQEFSEITKTGTDEFATGLYISDKQIKELVLNSMIYKGTDLLGFLFSMCTKLYRRDFAMKVISLIPKTLKRGEDFVFNNLYLLECSSLYVSKEICYHYRYYEGSTVTSPCPDFVQQIGMSQMVLQKAFAKSVEQEEVRDELLRRLHMRTLLNFIRLWNDEIGQRVHIPYYCFDYGKLGEGRIILYGAGKVGVDYYIQLIKTAPDKLVLWVDRNAKKYQSEEYPVMPVEAISNVSFDKILIAVQSESLALEIRDELVRKFQIYQDMILWQLPKCYWI